MVDFFHNPLFIFIVALGVAFILTLAGKINKGSSVSLFLLALVFMPLFSGIGFFEQIFSGNSMEIYTAGFRPPFSINLRFGLFEAAISFAVNLAGLFGGLYLLEKYKDSVMSMIVYLVLLTGINGMIMTRDLFNMFVFIEITCIASYALIAFDLTKDSLVGGFKYALAGGVISIFFLLGTILLYHLTGTLNIDQIISMKESFAGGPIGGLAIMMVVGAILIELKPFPANGQGLDVYQTTSSGMAVIISTAVSSGFLMALYKLLPLLGTHGFYVIAGIGTITFAASNLMGLKQSSIKRLLGYSSIGQIGLLIAALAFLFHFKREGLIPLVVGTLFVNHFLAKAGLFWITGIYGKEKISEWFTGQSKFLVLFSGIFIVALLGLPPFPGFWGKWELARLLAEKDSIFWLILIVFGSLFEAVYLFRWFSSSAREEKRPEEGSFDFSLLKTVPTTCFGVSLFLLGAFLTYHLNPGYGVYTYLNLPLVGLAGFYLLSRLPNLIQGLMAVATIGTFSFYLIPVLDGVALVFGVMFLGGSLLILFASIYRQNRNNFFYALIVPLVISLGLILQTKTYVGFFYLWEIIAITSYLLIMMGDKSSKASVRFIIMSLASAFFILVAFVIASAKGMSPFIVSVSNLSGPMAIWVFALFGLGILIKVGGLGLHIWVPGAYGEAEDDFSAMISSVVSKVPVFALFLIGIHFNDVLSKVEFNFFYFLSWFGLITALFGSLMALFQEDAKKLLAYSSMAQVGYIVSGFAIMSHMGLVTSLYLSINHLLYKALIFLAVAGVIFATNTRDMYKMGGLIKKMPISFISVMFGIIAMSGVPPLTGFGGKWLHYVSLLEKGWYFQIALAFFASAVGFLYMFRLIHAIFLGIAKDKHSDVKEAPLWLIVPQLAIMGIVMLFSMYPRLLVGPLSNAVSTYFAPTFQWDGPFSWTGAGNLLAGPMNSYWNGNLIMNAVGVMFALTFVWLFIARQRVQKVKQFNIVYAAERPDRPETTHVAYNFFAHYQKAIGHLVRPRATSFWETMTEFTHTLSSFLRRLVYTGNAQTYMQYIVVFFIVFYFLIRGY